MLDTAHRYFLEVFRTGSIKDAAANLHVVSSAVSRQITKLEEETGTPLFERRPNGMAATRAGNLLFDYVQRAAMDAQRARHELRSLRGGESSTIRMGVNETVGRNVLASILGAYRKAHPEVVFRLKTASSAGVTQALVDGSVDIGLAFHIKTSAPPASNIDVRYEVDSPLSAIMAPDHPLAGRTQIALDDLKPYPIALTDSGATVRLLFDACAGTGDGSPFDIAFSSNSSSIIYAIVRGGHAITLGGEIILRGELGRRELVSVPLTEPQFASRTLRIQTAAKRPLPEAAEAFVQALIEAM
ncbi:MULTISPECIES: LysR family transcriptional regulator [unclassified Achromobacter]|uniref:LysR family transcriptional regulator n=1 Tax=unclassified Achromobacter TaxID=2626865 RepID=UPI000B515CCB|nr:MULTISPECIES: LysR family transcriptional regulator [unclassified Achromobacter]OWT70160.1 LysR family transcriptional regulator [Achromobacter sp. HZ34]OWT71699.1 LysR family transcriptional regulator [Achromobacter sp. HZ28]